MSFTTPIHLGILNGTTGFRLDGVSSLDFSGSSVASAGDVNGDGFGDLIIGAPQGDSGGMSTGSSYVVFGRSSAFTFATPLSGLDGTTGFRIDGHVVSGNSGTSVASAGDVNGDGFADLIIGAQGANVAHVVFGRASGFAATLSLATLDGSNGFRLAGASDNTGVSVASAGDVNGDGFADLILGANTATGGGSFSGAAHVVFGRASGFAASLSLSTLDGTNGFRLPGVASSDIAGRSVASAGDVNGDGLADIIIGADQADPGGIGAAGSSYVVFGRTSGFGASFALGTLDGTTGFRLDGVGVNDQSGASVSAAGDVNGDGFGDIIIGAAGADINGSDAGVGYVVFGRASGFAATLNLGALNGTTGFRLDGVGAADAAGRSVAAAGDVNGDGFADLIIGAPGADTNGSASGSSYLVFGQASGWTATLSLSALTASTGIRLDGGTLNDQSGGSVASAGDVDGDGFADLVIGAPNATRNSIGNAGVSFVYFSPDTGAATYRGTTLADTLHGTPDADTMNGNGRNDRLFGGGGHDTIDGDAGNDTLDGGAGNDTLDGGGGTDTASFSSAGAGVAYGLLSQGTAITSAAGTDMLTGFENLQGSAFDDTLGGGLGANTLSGGAGDDALFAWGGNDRLEGNAGNDTLYGSTTGTDVLAGGAGVNIYQINAVGTVIVATGADYAFVTIDGWTPPVGLAAAYLVGAITQAAGGNSADVLVANAGVASTLSGGDGDDTLWGQDQADTLMGGLGNDILIGGGGADVLTGGAGWDKLVGGTGADIFTFTSNADDYDQIFDFSRAQGDQIRIAVAGGPTSLARLDVYESGGNTWLLFGGVRIDVYGVLGMTAGDFLFA